MCAGKIKTKVQLLAEIKQLDIKVSTVNRTACSGYKPENVIGRGGVGGRVGVV